MELVHCPGCDAFNPPQSSVCRQCQKPLPNSRGGDSPDSIVGPVSAPTKAASPAPHQDRVPPFEAAPEVLDRVRVLQRNISERPGAKALYLQLSQIYADAGRRDLALGVLEQLLSVDPGNVYVRHRIDQLKRPPGPPSRAAVGTSAISGGPAGARRYPRRAAPSGPMESVRGLISNRPKLALVIAAGVLVLAVLSVRLVLPSARRLVAGDFRAYAPKWSPTGRHFAFLIEQRGRIQLAVYDMREHSYDILSEVSGWEGSSFAWSPQGLRIAYLAPPDEGEWQTTVSIIDLERGETSALASGSSPLWWADNTSLVAQCPPKPIDFVEGGWQEWTPSPPGLCLIDAVSGTVQEVAELEAFRKSFSPALHKIAFDRIAYEEITGSGGPDPDQEFEEFVDRVVAGRATNVAEGRRDLARELEARRYMEEKQSPGDAELPFTSDVFVTDIHGGEPIQLTDDGRSSLISWTPDGRRILYANAGPSGIEVWSMSPDGDDRSPVINSPVSIADPFSVTLTPDGKYALFVSPVSADKAIAKVMTGETPADIHIVRLGSSSVRRLENQHPFKQRYALSPDGKHIVYEVLTEVRVLRGEGLSELWLTSR